MSNLLASALVAAVVTMLIEYIAKPGMEARKERILEGTRVTRSTIAELQLAQHLFSKLSAARHQDSPMQSFESEPEMRARIVRTIDPVMEAAASGKVRTSPAARHASMAYVAVVEFWRDDFGGDDESNAQTVVEFAQLAITAMRTPWWRRRQLSSIQDTLTRQGFAADGSRG